MNAYYLFHAGVPRNDGLIVLFSFVDVLVEGDSPRQSLDSYLHSPYRQVHELEETVVLLEADTGALFCTHNCIPAGFIPHGPNMAPFSFPMRFTDYLVISADDNQVICERNWRDALRISRIQHPKSVISLSTGEAYNPNDAHSDIPFKMKGEQGRREFAKLRHNAAEKVDKTYNGLVLQLPG